MDAHYTSQEAEQRFKSTLGVAKVEFKPTNIASNAVQNAKDKVSSAAGSAKRAVTSRPGTVLVVGSAIGLYFFRRPIAAAISKRLSRYKDSEADVPSLSTDTPTGKGPIADPTPKTPLIEEV